MKLLFFASSQIDWHKSLIRNFDSLSVSFPWTWREAEDNGEEERRKVASLRPCKSSLRIFNSLLWDRRFFLIEVLLEQKRHWGVGLGRTTEIKWLGPAAHDDKRREPKKFNLCNLHFNHFSTLFRIFAALRRRKVSATQHTSSETVSF